MIYHYKDLNMEQLKDLLQLNSEAFFVKRGRFPLSYTGDSIGFDIETTTVDEKSAYMYHWQLSFNDNVILGRLWEEVTVVFGIISDQLESFKKNDRYTRKVFCWVANLGFEFQFMKSRFHITNLFAKEKRNPLKFDLNGSIEFRDCLAIAGGNLDNLAKTYCTTQKLVGDLDYKKLRNSQTPLTKKEEDYCVNDVVILKEWNDYINKEYLFNNRQVPFTKTSIVRNKVLEAIPSDKRSLTRLNTSRLMCDQEDYMKYMCFLYRGGYSHANYLLANEVYENCGAYDFTSSYPSVMLDKAYPMSAFIDEEIDNFERIIELAESYCFILCVSFYGMTSTTTHSIESLHKCLEVDCDKFEVDNGRLHSCRNGHITVLLTEYDLKTYLKFYNWKRYKIHWVKKAIKHFLPDYLVKTMLNDYQRKNDLKKKGLSHTKEYSLCKADVNSYYGMCCTRYNPTSYNIDEAGQWIEEKNSTDFEKHMKKQVLSPFWGIWISAIARYNLLDNVYKLAKYVICNDTDSMKLNTVNKEVIEVVEQYNNKIIQRNKEVSERLGVNFELIKDLGTFDDETKGTPLKRLKTLGAKRYIYEDSEGIHPVIAGLPKQAFIDYVNKNNIDAFELFTKDMFFGVEISQKRKAYYNDQKHTHIVEGERMTELSSCSITETKFKLTLNEIYYQIIMKKIERIEGEHYEPRIY